MYGLYGMSGPYIVLMYGSNPYILAPMYGSNPYILASVYGSKIFYHTLYETVNIQYENIFFYNKNTLL